MTLARSTKTHQEILYYLAEHDPDPEVRKAVAVNKKTPMQASPILAGDRNEDVRMALAQRLVTLLPQLTQDKHSQLYAFAAQALGTLALDEVLKIRKALSSTLKDYAHAPPKVVGQLARDVEREISEPILRFCSALSDEDLLDIIKGHPASWAVQAIAGRHNVSERISQAVIDVDDPPAGIILLENSGAMISRKLLEAIVEKARFYPEWQKPAALHKNLSPETAAVLAEFADVSVRDVLMRRSDFNKEAVDGIAIVFRRRLQYAGAAESATDPALRAKKLDRQGQLTEETLADALAMRDRDFVITGLARLTGTTAAKVRGIFDMKAPKSIVALCWRAGLSMRFALQLQKEMGQILPKDLIYPRGGTDYPLTNDELVWQLEFLGLEAA
jgi:uncharacterized protein (DUF2336 family)